jgi:pimeloyl-ACP methyl ester carboxylesterase
VLHAEALGPRPTIVLSQSRYDEDEEGIPPWAGPIFARQQAKLAALGDDVIHARAEDTGHFIHWERPELVVTAIAEVVRAVSTGRPLAPCEEVFDDPVATCL